MLGVNDLFKELRRLLLGVDDKEGLLERFLALPIKKSANEINNVAKYSFNNANRDGCHKL